MIHNRGLVGLAKCSSGEVMELYFRALAVLNSLVFQIALTLTLSTPQGYLRLNHCQASEESRIANISARRSQLVSILFSGKNNSFEYPKSK